MGEINNQKYKYIYRRYNIKTKLHKLNINLENMKKKNLFIETKIK